MSKKEKVNHVVVLLDETGSMESCKEDTIGGFNNFIEEQKRSKNNIKFYLTLFNSGKIEKRYKGTDIRLVKKLSYDDYAPANFTPLWDAIGNTIKEFNKEKKILFVIMTDGQENSSKEFNAASIKNLIKEKEEDFNWKFIYIGMDLDNFDDAIKIGINTQASTSKLDVIGTFSAFSNTVSRFCKTGEVEFKNKGDK